MSERGTVGRGTVSVENVSRGTVGVENVSRGTVGRGNVGVENVSRGTVSRGYVGKGKCCRTFFQDVFSHNTSINCNGGHRRRFLSRF